MNPDPAKTPDAAQPRKWSAVFAEWELLVAREPRLLEHRAEVQAELDSCDELLARTKEARAMLTRAERLLLAPPDAEPAPAGIRIVVLDEAAGQEPPAPEPLTPGPDLPPPPAEPPAAAPEVAEQASAPLPPAEPPETPASAEPEGAPPSVDPAPQQPARSPAPPKAAGASPVIRDHPPRPAQTPPPVVAAPKAAPAPAPRDLPPLNTQTATATNKEVKIVRDALKAQGRPMSESLLGSRVSRHGLKIAVLKDALAQLVALGQVTVSESGQYTFVNAGQGS